MKVLQVRIARGTYRNMPVSGTFPMIKPWQDAARGGFVTVHVENPAPTHSPIQRYKCHPDDCIVIDADGNELPMSAVTQIQVSTYRPTSAVQTAAVTNHYEDEFMKDETDEDAMARIAETFQMLDRITASVARGAVRGLIVAGPPGVGKSFGVEHTLSKHSLLKVLAGDEPDYEILSGGVSAVGLYQKLYHWRHAGKVLMIDDSDGVFNDEETLNLLKGALNSGERRRICWNKESRVLTDNEIPNAFDFEGGVIFLTNISFEKAIARGSRISAHLSALMSRCHYLDLEIGSTRDKLLRIKQIVRDGDMLDRYNFTPEQTTALVDFVVKNAPYLREISLRMVKKVADFMHSDPDYWEPMAVNTCLLREAKFRRLVEQRDALIIGDDGVPLGDPVEVFESA